jgi:hypothetical protein
MSEKKLTYHEIKERELKVVENYDESDLDRYIKLLILAKKIFSEQVLWVFSWIPFLIIWFLFYIFNLIKIDLPTIITFVISHIIYWVISGKKSTQKFIDDVVPELEMVIDVLIEIKEERLKK